MPNTARLNEAIVTLAGILQRKKDAGEVGILLAKEHLDLLKQLPQKIRQHHCPPTPAVPGHLFSTTATATSTGLPEVSDKAADSSARVDTEFLSRGIERLNPNGANKRAQLNHLARMVQADEQCRALGTLRETMVFATGDPDARLMLVGEAPGAEEERLKKPFVGPAGQLLDKILVAMELSRDEVYISNIVKFRPQVANAKSPDTGNRKPSSEEIASCLKYIMAEIDVVQPAVIIALGGTAATGLLGDNSPVGRLRGQTHSLKGIPLVVTYHPSYLLHCESNSPGKLKAEKAKVWHDMKLAMEMLKGSSW
jgi:uracil-DNA glycosylase family 4